MKLILKILFFTIVTNLSYSQETVCDCVEIGIQTFKMIESGTSEEETQKIFEKKNNKCMEIKNKLGNDFEKKMTSCANFKDLIKITTGIIGDSEVKPEVCECVDFSIKTMELMKKGVTEKELEKKYKSKRDICEKLNSDLGAENFGMQMMNCENFSQLMELMLSEQDN